MVDDSPLLITLAQWLSGEFSNQQQALDEPVWFVNLRWWHRPLPWRVDGHLALFAEQANALYPDQSYRQRILVLQDGAAPGTQTLQVNYFGFKHPERVRGAGINPALLNNLSPDDLEALPGCALEVTYGGDRFIGTMRPGDRCRFQYQGNIGQVILGFEVSARKFLSYDKGVDPNTEQPLWGALMGPYIFSKVENFPLFQSPITYSPTG